MANDEQTPAFEVIDPKSGHRWMVFADGHVEGFGESVVVINRIPMAITRGVVEMQNAALQSELSKRHGPWGRNWSEND